MVNEKRDKALGMLLGLHAGDSLGAPLEFGSPTSGELIRNITGGGIWEAGEPTDDTDMMVCLLKSLSENSGKFVCEDVRSKYTKWLIGRPKDVGICTRSSLIGRPVSRRQGNGSLMRCAPLALIDPSYLDIGQQCRITHDDGTTVYVDNIFIQILKEFLQTKNTSKNAAKYLIDEIMDSFYFENWESIKKSPWEGIINRGWCVTSLLNALWAFYNTETLEDALIQIVNRGGDSDTVGAICGAICGAWYGVEAIPERWLSTLQAKDTIIEHVDRLLLTPSIG